MSAETRLKGVMPALSALERALLCLGVLKDRTKKEDPTWRLYMPPDQAPEFNRYIDLVNAANMKVAALIITIDKETERLDLCTAWLSTLHLWQAHVEQIENGYQLETYRDQRHRTAVYSQPVRLSLRSDD